MKTSFIKDVFSLLTGGFGFMYRVRFFDKHNAPFHSPVLDGYLCAKRSTLTLEQVSGALASYEGGSLLDGCKEVLEYFIKGLGYKDVHLKVLERA